MKLEARWFVVSSFLSLACGGGQSPPPATSAEPVTCPSGQRYERGYCVAERSEAPSPPSTATPRDERPPQSGATESPPGSPPGSSPGTSSEPAPSVEAPPSSPTAEQKLAAPVDLSMAASAAPFIQYLSAAHLPAGARPFGVAFAGQFAEGQVLEQRVQLTPGKCYTVVAAGIPPVREVDLALYPREGEGRGSVALATDHESGSQAVLGRKTDCFRPTDAQKELVLVVSVRLGQGVAAAQMFEK